MPNSPQPTGTEQCFVTPDTLSPRHQDLLQVSPLLRDHCAEKLLSREEEQRFFQQMADYQRELFALNLQLTPVRESTIEMLNLKVAEPEPAHRLGTQLRALASSGILEKPLSTDAYMDQIEVEMFEQVRKINASRNSDEQIELIADIILHPTLREEVGHHYDEAYTALTPTDSQREQHQRITTLHQEIEALKDRLVKYNLRLVIKHAAVYAKHHLDLHDLIQEGTIGLMRACDLYDHRRGYKFSTYASRWILQTILNLLNEITFTIQVPRNISQTYRNVNRYIDQEVKRSGKAPSSLKIAAVLNIDEQDVLTVLRSTWVATSLNTPLDQDSSESNEIIDLVPDDEDAYEQVDLFMQYRLIKELIEQIPSDRDREILKRRYAIGYGESTLVEIAAEYGLTKERIRQIINQQIGKIREQITEQQST